MTAIAILQFSPVPAYFCCGWVKSPICNQKQALQTKHFETPLCNTHNGEQHPYTWPAKKVGRTSTNNSSIPFFSWIKIANSCTFMADFRSWVSSDDKTNLGSCMPTFGTANGSSFMDTFRNCETLITKLHSLAVLWQVLQFMKQAIRLLRFAVLTG